MAKGQKRSGREPKKPKATKTAAPSSGSVFQREPPKPVAPKGATK
jgi:hypothetical protein